MVVAVVPLDYFTIVNGAEHHPNSCIISIGIVIIIYLVNVRIDITKLVFSQQGFQYHC